MTTIAYKDGVVAADSRETWDSEAGGASYHKCAKLFRKKLKNRDVVIATAGATYSGMVFVDWYGSDTPAPDHLTMIEDSDKDFDALILDSGKLYQVNHMCRPVEIVDGFIAIGSGRKSALAAMHCGKSAEEAVRIACLIDPYSAPPVYTARMPLAAIPKKRKRK